MLTSSKTFDAFLALVRLGIGHAYSDFPDDVDWAAIKALAGRHRLSAVVLDGIGNLPNKNRPPRRESLTWFGEIMKRYEQRYGLYRKAIAELAGWHRAHGFQMMVLKGYACSLDWPKPEHRPCGDIDIWQFGKQKEADAEQAAGENPPAETAEKRTGKTSAPAEKKTSVRKTAAGSKKEQGTAALNDN